MPSTVVRILGLSLLLLCSTPAAQAAEVWLRVETANFELVGNATEVEVRAVAERLERFREAISKFIPVRPNAVKTRVVVFRDDASFRPFKPKKADGSPDDLVAGLFQPGPDVNYIAIAAGGADLSTIYHEYTHDVLNAGFGSASIPAWLNEGLAEYFQTFRIIDGQTAEIGSAPRTHISLLRRGPLIPWDEFFRTDSYSLQERGAHSRTLFYAQAWAVIRYFAGSSPSAFDPKEIQRNAAAIERSRLDGAIRSYISAEVPPSPLKFEAASPHIPPSAVMPPAEVDARLGDLLYHLKDYSAAETRLRAALALNPELPAANASLGMVKLRQRSFAEAKRFIEKAVANNANDHLVHFYYAYLLTRENMNAAGLVSGFSPETARRIRETLRRAIRLNDRFAESYRLLAFTALVTNEELDEALAALRKAEELRPGDAEIALMVPQILLRQEKADEARSAAVAVLGSTSDPARRREAEQLIAAADELAAHSTTRRIVISDSRQPVIYQRKDLTDEQMARIETERVINNTNLLIDRPKYGERQAVGRLGRIGCRNERILYPVVTTDGISLLLTGRRFDDLRVKVLIEGTRSFAFRCDERVTDELAVIIYRPARPSGGELVSIAFVPASFKLRTLQEVAETPQVIIQGGPATLLDENLRSAAEERAEMERVMRETRLRDLEERLRPARDGEKRVLATPESLVCSDGRMILTAKAGTGTMSFAATIENRFEAASFNPETGVLEIGCRSQLPALPAVITFRENKNDRELIAVEFVPGFYSLP